MTSDQNELLASKAKLFIIFLLSDHWLFVFYHLGILREETCLHDGLGKLVIMTREEETENADARGAYPC